MGPIDRMKQKQQENQEQQEQLSEFGGHIVNSIDEAAQGVNVLRGDCPKCGTAVEAETPSNEVQVVCVSCNSTVVLTS